MLQTSYMVGDECEHVHACCWEEVTNIVILFIPIINHCFGSESMLLARAGLFSLRNTNLYVNRKGSCFL